MVALTSAVPICTLESSTSPPVQVQSSWWRVCWGSPLLPLLMSAPLWLLLLLLQPSQNEPTWIMLMFLYVNVSFHILLMRLSTSAFSPLPLLPRARPLVLSSVLPNTGDWLNVVPSTPLGLHLTNCEFRCCLHYWFGVPLHSNSYPCPECGGSVDTFGITRLGVAAMAIESPATTTSETSSLTPLNQLL